MTDKKDIKTPDTSDGDEMRTLGNPADVSIKDKKPQVSDVKKIRSAIDTISDLDARLSALNNSKSGPFGSDDEDVDFINGKVDGLFEDEASTGLSNDPVEEDILGNIIDELDEEGEPETETSDEDILFDAVSDQVATAGKKNQEAETEVNDFDLDQLLGETSAENNDPAPTPVSEPVLDDLDEVTSISSVEAAAEGDEDFNNSMNDFLEDVISEEAINLEDFHEDPVNEIVDEQLSSTAVDDKQSPFAALFSPVTEESNELFDAGLPDDEETDVSNLPSADDIPSMDIEDDEELFFSDFHTGNDEGHLPATLPGSDLFGNEEGDFPDTDEADASGGFEAPSDLPQLTMGGDESFYAPGTEPDAYTDEHNLISEDLYLPDSEDEIANIEENTKEDVVMAVSDNQEELGGEFFQPDDEHESNTFVTEGLDDLLDEEGDQPAVDPSHSDNSDIDDIFGDASSSESVDPITVSPAQTHVEETPEYASEDVEGAPGEAASAAKKKKIGMMAIGGLALMGSAAAVAVAVTTFYATPDVKPLVVEDRTQIHHTGAGAGSDIEMPDSHINTIDPQPQSEGTIRLADLIGNNSSEPITDIEQELSGLVDPVNMDDTPEAGIEDAVGVSDLMDTDGDPSGDVQSVDTSGADTPADIDQEATDISDEEVYDPISDLAAQIEGSGTRDNDVDVEDEPVDNSDNGSLFVEETRVVKIEKDVTNLGLQLNDLTGEISQMNELIMQSMQRNSVINDRVESNERSLRGVSAILTEFSKVRESLDQTQIVLLDIAARVGSLEGSNPADRTEVSKALEEIDGEMKRLTANMAILARMTVNGVSALQAGGASSGNHSVQTSQAQMPASGNDTVYSNGSEVRSAETVSTPPVPAGASEGDFIEGYGYVLDVVPASGDQNLVVMENGSVLVPK